MEDRNGWRKGNQREEGKQFSSDLMHNTDDWECEHKKDSSEHRTDDSEHKNGDQKTENTDYTTDGNEFTTDCEHKTDNCEQKLVFEHRTDNGEDKIENGEHKSDSCELRTNSEDHTHRTFVNQGMCAVDKVSDAVENVRAPENVMSLTDSHINTSSGVTAHCVDGRGWDDDSDSETTQNGNSETMNSTFGASCDSEMSDTQVSASSTEVSASSAEVSASSRDTETAHNDDEENCGELGEGQHALSGPIRRHQTARQERRLNSAPVPSPQPSSSSQRRLNLPAHILAQWRQVGRQWGVEDDDDIARVLMRNYEDVMAGRPPRPPPRQRCPDCGEVLAPVPCEVCGPHMHSARLSDSDHHHHHHHHHGGGTGGFSEGKGGGGSCGRC